MRGGVVGRGSASEIWRASRSAVVLCLVSALALGCPTPPRPDARAGAIASAEGASGPREEERSPPRNDEGGADVEVEAPALADDPTPLLHATTDELLSLVTLPVTDAGTSRAEGILRAYIAPVPGRFSQGNPSQSGGHDVTRRACLEGLRGVVLQTDEQRKTCHGMENMVPIFTGGNPASAKACIDVFEFPNRACELPMVWGTPSGAERICAAEGKRLCTQSEWNLACKGDPEGKADSTYSYGEDLDLTICNTNKPHLTLPNGQWLCSALTAQTAWVTCATETEPSGSFPRCKSRFGVYDLNGNVAEMMSRLGSDKVVYTQLKGSAFFYVDVARKPTEAQKPDTRETYPDQCTYDPRWHVEPLESSLHSNYHLGFRCCLPL